jgi:WD40 repeat protein
VAFAPDGRLLVSGSSEGTLRLRDEEGGREVVRLRGPGAWPSGPDVVCVAFGPDSRRVASGSWDQRARVWGVPDGAQQACFPVPDNVVRSVAFSPDGRRLAGASSSQARIWDLADGRELVCLRDHGGQVRSVAFAPDGRRVATGATDGAVRLWDAATGERLACFRGPDPVGIPPSLWHHYSGVLALAWSPDGRFLAAGYRDRVVRVWDARHGGPVAELFGHAGRVHAVTFTADGRRIASGSEDGTVRLWHTEGGRPLAPLRGHKNRVTQVRFAAQGQRLLSHGQDVTLRLWDAGTGEELSCLCGDDDENVLRDPDRQSDVTSLTRYRESPDGWRLIFEASLRSGRPANYLVWDLRRGDVSPMLGDEHIQFYQGGRWVVTTSAGDERIRVWDLEAGQEVACFQVPPGDILAVSTDGRWILSRTSDGQSDGGHVWDVEARCLRSCLDRPANQAEQLQFSPDGRRILGVTTGARPAVCIWETERGGEPLLLGGDRDLSLSASFAPDGRSILTRSVSDIAHGPTVRIWDAQTGAELIHLAGGAGCLWSVEFSRDGRRFLAVASNDTTIRVWDLPGGRLRAQFRHYPSKMDKVEFSFDGRHVVSVEQDHTIRVWDAASGDELAHRRDPALRWHSVVFLPDGQSIGYEGWHGRRVWNFRTGVCRAADWTTAANTQWRAVEAGAETQVVAADTGEAVAWLPLKLWHLTGHPDGRTWAGAAGNHLYLLTLEGGEGSTAAGARPPPLA